MSNNTITLDDVDSLIKELEDDAKTIERIEKDVKLMKTFINQMKEIGIE